MKKSETPGLLAKVRKNEVKQARAVRAARAHIARLARMRRLNNGGKP